MSDMTPCGEPALDQPDVRERNESRDYALSLMRWIVIQPTNGGTDQDDIAAFAYESDALAYQYTCHNANPSVALEIHALGREFTS